MFEEPERSPVSSENNTDNQDSISEEEDIAYRESIMQIDIISNMEVVANTKDEFPYSPQTLILEAIYNGFPGLLSRNQLKSRLYGINKIVDLAVDATKKNKTFALPTANETMKGYENTKYNGPKLATETHTFDVTVKSQKATREAAINLPSQHLIMSHGNPTEAQFLSFLPDRSVNKSLGVNAGERWQNHRLFQHPQVTVDNQDFWYASCTVSNNKSGQINQCSQLSIIDNIRFKADVEFINNATQVFHKLPLYQVLINGHPCTVLIDSGASSNYINTRLQNLVTNITPVEGQSVEVANGNTSHITAIAEFTIDLNEYHDDIQAYVFDTKFDLILGQSWLTRIQPVPNWFNSTWKIHTGPNTDTIITPINKTLCTSTKNKTVQPRLQNMTEVQNKLPQADNHNFTKSSIDDSADTSLDFLLSAKQFDRLLKKKQIEKCYFIDVHQILQSDMCNQMEDTKTNKSVTNMHQQWCDEFTKKFPNVFKGTIDSLPPMRDTTENMIELYPDFIPQSIPPYKMSPLELRELRSQLDTLISQGLIEPTSSQYGSPVLFVKRQGDSKMRMVCDYRSINKATISQGIPVPRIDECLEQLHGAKYFSSLDLKSGFHQLRLTDTDSDKTTINTRYGQFRWKVIPFGLKNSGRQFMRTTVVTKSGSQKQN